MQKAGGSRQQAAGSRGRTTGVTLLPAAGCLLPLSVVVPFCLSALLPICPSLHCVFGRYGPCLPHPGHWICCGPSLYIGMRDLQVEHLMNFIGCGGAADTVVAAGAAAAPSLALAVA